MKHGQFDCANPACKQYHVLVEHRLSRPRCSACGKRLRLFRVFHKMSAATKERLRSYLKRGVV